MKDVKKYAWYFPNWHVTSFNESGHGKGWTEWEVVKYAVPRFEGHSQPKKPLWGYEDESNPKVFEKKIQTAHDYGLDGFIFDFYWFKELGPHRRDALDKGFLKAENNELCEFGIMWANHDPVYAHPCGYMHDNNALTTGSADVQMFYEITDYCIKHYFPKANYIRIDGKCYFGIWDLNKLIHDFGGIEGTAIMLNDFRRRAKEAGFEVHLACRKHSIPGFGGEKHPLDAGSEGEVEKEYYEEKVRQLGIDSAFNYTWAFSDVEEWPKIDYVPYREKNIALYETESAYSNVPLDITVSTGWDCSPRTCVSDRYERVGYPYSPIVVNNTPEEVEKAFVAAKKFIESDKFTGNMLTISTWNEWTEGCYMEPDEEYGYGFLEAFKKVFVE